MAVRPLPTCLASATLVALLCALAVTAALAAESDLAGAFQADEAAEGCHGRARYLRAVVESHRRPERQARTTETTQGRTGRLNERAAVLVTEGLVELVEVTRASTPRQIESTLLR